MIMGDIIKKILNNDNNKKIRKIKKRKREL